MSPESPVSHRICIVPITYLAQLAHIYYVRRYPPIERGAWTLDEALYSTKKANKTLRCAPDLKNNVRLCSIIISCML